MQLLVDTHILIWIINEAHHNIPDRFRALISNPKSEAFMSAASFWELAIKHRLGKLQLYANPYRIALALEALGFRHLAVSYHHACFDLGHEIQTKDPFDRLILAQCEIESLRLLTLDRHLLNHPNAIQPSE